MLWCHKESVTYHKESVTQHLVSYGIRDKILSQILYDTFDA